MLNLMPDHLLRLIASAEAAFATFDARYWALQRGEGKWTHLQLLGHLIDSAANNHQRIVRALAQPSLNWAGYDQMAHVMVQSYSGANLSNCLALWAAYNRHISHVIRQISPAKTLTPCSIAGAPFMTLCDLVLDYVAHLEHHLKQILPGQLIEYSGMPWPPDDPNRQLPV